MKKAKKAIIAAVGVVSAFALNNEVMATTSIPWGLGTGTLLQPKATGVKPTNPSPQTLTFVSPSFEDEPYSPADDPWSPLVIKTPNSPWSPTLPDEPSVPWMESFQDSWDYLQN